LLRTANGYSRLTAIASPERLDYLRGMTILHLRPTDTPLALALLRRAAGVPTGPLPADSDDAVLALTAAPLSALGRLVAPLVAGLRASGDFDALRPHTRRLLLARRDDAVRADLVARRFLAHRLLPAWPEGMPVALVKGVALNGLAYGDDEPRQARDLDLVVAAADHERALAVLTRLGGRVVHVPGRRISHARSPERTVRFEGARPVEVDLHAGFSLPRLFPVAEGLVWARAVPWPVAADSAARVLAPGDALAHLAAHAITHARLGARSLVDAHRLVTRGSVDWASLPSVAASWSAATPLFLLLHAARAALDTPVDSEALASLAPVGWKQRLGSALLGSGRVDVPSGLPVAVRRVLALVLLEQPGAALGVVPRQAALRVLDVLDRLLPRR